MSKLRVIYIASLIILALLVTFTIFHPMATGGKYSEVQREQLLQTEDQWVIQFDIINREGRDQNYIITVVVDNKPYQEDVLIRDGGTFTYIYHIYRDKLVDAQVGFVVHKEGVKDPIEQVT